MSNTSFCLIPSLLIHITTNDIIEANNIIKKKHILGFFFLFSTKYFNLYFVINSSSFIKIHLFSSFFRIEKKSNEYTSPSLILILFSKIFFNFNFAGKTKKDSSLSFLSSCKLK